MKLLIKNGVIITESDQYQADIIVSGGRIHEIRKEAATSELFDQVVEANGCYIFPGGIDPHVHMHLPSPAGFSSDDFFSGSHAALFGGTTTLIDFVTPCRGQSLTEALDRRLEEASSALTHCTFHISPIEWRDSTKDEISKCIDRGFKSFKVYMAYKQTVGLNDDHLLKVMQAVAQAGGLVVIHCEMGDEIEVLRNQYVANGNTEPIYHALSRPGHTESEAVKRAIELADQALCPLYIVHVSAKESLEHIRTAQQQGQRVYAETCPQYLLLDDRKYDGPFEQTAPYVLSPPLRKPADKEALWQALSDGTIQTVGTDHCPFMFSQKAVGRDDFRKIPNGVGGVEHRLALLFTYGVLQNRITLNQFIKLTSTNAATIFGLFPAKGNVSAGADADLVIWNPVTQCTISATSHHQNCDTNIYAGIAVEGFPEYVIKDGQLVV
ncbi:MAG: dihydropyrimidinase [Bacteroidales bacterium]|nr:dihydropyrimidinase [Bacteroidales bacterium]MDZ4203903.1 dihydropyrimidinase [Bacteroidales bacterium]